MGTIIATITTSSAEKKKTVALLDKKKKASILIFFIIFFYFCFISFSFINFFFAFDLIRRINSDIWHLNALFFNERALSSVSSWVAIREKQLDEFMIPLR